MIETIENIKELCTGCNACVNACPVDCITPKPNGEGFLYPVADSEKCIKCGKCVSVCPVNRQYSGHPKGEAYACVNNDKQTQKISSSGGVFALVAKCVLAQKGTVFGAAFDGLKVRHIAVKN